MGFTTVTRFDRWYQNAGPLERRFPYAAIVAVVVGVALQSATGGGLW